jgi:hypothetical protein
LPFLACAGDRVFLLPPAAGFAPATGAAPLLPLLAAGEVATLGAGTTVLPFGLYAGFAADFFVAAGFLATGAAEEDFLTLFVAALASPTDKKPKDKTAAERKSLLDKDSELIALAWTWKDLLDCFAAVGLAATLVAAKDADWVKENIFLRVRYMCVL